MHVAVSKESYVNEARVALTPSASKKLIQAGFRVSIESNAGQLAGFSDKAYQQAGATISGRDSLLANTNILLQVRQPNTSTLAALSANTVTISLLDPFNYKDLLQTACQQQLSTLSLEMLPRTTYAQKMDVLSSQASLAGYAAIIQGCSHLKQVLPMMTTPAGTLAPGRAFIIGAGVAGLQAIATAKRLGARVEAFDVRAEVAEQVQSLGAKFLEISLGADDGPQVYAKTLTPEQLAKQKAGMIAACAQANLVITTAQVFGRQAPRLLDATMLDAMQPGAVVVDMAVEQGGNVEGSVANQVVTRENGAIILGPTNLASTVATHASTLFANNLVNLLLEFTNPESQQLHWDWSHELLAACLITHQGQIVHPRTQEATSS